MSKRALDTLLYEASYYVEAYATKKNIKINWDGVSLSLNGIVYESKYPNDFNQSLVNGMRTFLSEENMISDNLIGLLRF